ncbi:MAG: hypothetical protein [Arizlama microvirus]|nr:MAG: hypothetical protein [Arizlama microvirus]
MKQTLGECEGGKAVADPLTLASGASFKNKTIQQQQKKKVTN